jgi:hypothetical protein
MLAVAKELAQEINIIPQSIGGHLFCWSQTASVPMYQRSREIRDTEWDFIMLRMIEPKLIKDQEQAGSDMDNPNYDCWSRYVDLMRHVKPYFYGSGLFATFNQRARAYCEVKGIKTGHREPIAGENQKHLTP